MTNFIHTNGYEHVRASRRAYLQSTIPAQPPKQNRLYLRRIDRSRGVQIDGLWYWHPRFAKAGQSEPVDVRRVPSNIGVVSVRFRGSWILAKPRRSTSRNRRFEEMAYRRREAAPDFEGFTIWPTIEALGMAEPHADNQSTI